MRLSALFPLACAVAAFVLSMLCIFAGNKPSFMGDYAIVTLNTSTLGQNILTNAVSSTSTTTAASSTATSTSTLSGILSWIDGEAHNITSAIEGEIEGILNTIANDVANTLSAELNIAQWYSLHLMTHCQGNFTPNATAPGAHKNLSSATCSHPTARYHFDLTQTLNTSIQNSALSGLLGGINLNSIRWPSTLTDSIETLNTLTDATFVFYCLGAAFSGLAIILAFITIFTRGGRLLSITNWIIANLAFLTLAIASAIVTAFAVKMTDLINGSDGRLVGLSASRGGGYLGLTWSATALMFLAAVAWVLEFCVGRRRERATYEPGGTEKLTGSRGWRGKI